MAIKLQLRPIVQHLSYDLIEFLIFFVDCILLGSFKSALYVV